ncbi:hypothetical protein [Alteromonas phage ZP6]|uniref:Uncharacterized protein n=1 Tax=Alteromonas phage ZP6 TaxID=2492447 RepID=A0A3S9U8A3_9CAUD|nr:hypothetical protein PQC03_gp42 [Alteromonas phage ZP6]AZS06545.1 hypothetical protein [Alteromonas phage ZP6]
MKYLVAIFTNEQAKKDGHEPTSVFMTNDIEEINHHLDCESFIGELAETEEQALGEGIVNGFEWNEESSDRHVVVRRGDFYISQPALKI